MIWRRDMLTQTEELIDVLEDQIFCMNRNRKRGERGGNLTHKNTVDSG